MPPSYSRRRSRRALERGDRRAAANLLDRAAQLFPEDAAESACALVDLGRSSSRQGHDYRGSRLALEHAVAGAEALEREDLWFEPGSSSHSSRCSLPMTSSRMSTSAFVRRAIEVLEPEGDEEGLSRAWFALAGVGWTKAQWDSMRELAGPSSTLSAPATRASSEMSSAWSSGDSLRKHARGGGIAETREIRRQHPDSLELQAWTNRLSER